MTLTLLTLVAGLLSGAAVQAGPAPDTQGQTCPPANIQGKRVVSRFVSSSEEPLRVWRDRHGIPSADTSTVRLLSAEQDRAICEGLHSFLRGRVPNFRAGRVPTFYEANGFYYIAVTTVPDDRPVPPGHARIRLGSSTLFVLDKDLTVRTIISL